MDFAEDYKETGLTGLPQYSNNMRSWGQESLPMTEFGYWPGLKLKTSSHYHMKSKIEGKVLASVTDFAIYNWDVVRIWAELVIQDST